MIRFDNLCNNHLFLVDVTKVVENGKVERVETSFERLHAGLPSVFREDQSIYEISPFQAGLIVTEAERLLLGKTEVLKK